MPESGRRPVTWPVVSDEPTTVIWITRRHTTVRHIRGLAEALDQADALAYAEVRIMPVDDEHGAELPGGMPLTMPDGTTLTVPPEGQVFTMENLPETGMVFLFTGP